MKEALLDMAMKMTTMRVWRTPRAVRKKPRKKDKQSCAGETDGNRGWDGDTGGTGGKEREWERER